MVSRKVEKIYSKNGLPIIQIEHEGKMLPIHSKYDPIKEAERILDSYNDEIEKYDHVLFYGIGLGYHVKLFFERYPYKLASTYEPIPEVFSECVSAIKEVKLPTQFIEYSFVEKSPEQIEMFLIEFSKIMHQKILCIVLPVYEKIANEQLTHFTSKFKESLEEKRTSTVIDMTFAKRWTLNALMNLKATFETPNILLQENNPFEGKPVILAAAGPSLSEEMENLRYIKENGLAYIFAVGSANKALMVQNIYPDAVLTYDPQGRNQYVFWNIIENKIDSIPMIFGTTVGFETVQNYPGPKFHFLTSQDTITPNFHDRSFPIINDSSSIAIVTLQLLGQLNVGEVILVGQNFAFKNNLFFAQEIERWDKEKEELAGADVQKDDLVGSYMVEDTFGGQVLTNKSFDRMRLEMERYIEIYSSLKVINATTGGAAIKGTVYRSLSELIKENLTEQIVDEHWYKYQKIELSEFAIHRLTKLQRDLDAYINQFEAIMSHFEELNRSLQRLNTNQIRKRLEVFDDLFKKFVNNTLFSLVLQPITRVFFEKLQAETNVIRVLEPTREKAERVIWSYSSYLHICREVYKEIAPVIHSVVFPSLSAYTGWKEYISTCGVFHYEGGWEKQLYDNTIEDEQELEEKELPEVVKKEIEKQKQKARENKVPIRIQSIQTKQKNAKIIFRFSGTKLALYGKNQSDRILKLRLTIDNKVTTVNIDKNINDEIYGLFIRNQIYKTTTLSSGMHNVTIEIISDGPDFLFLAAEIYKNERAYHIHEVTNFDELEIGKRIRGHYQAEYSYPGVFSVLGQEINDLIEPNSSKVPDGDFYFICVEKTKYKKVLISDRVIQTAISWDNLNDVGYIFGKHICIDNKFLYVRSMEGGKGYIDSQGSPSVTDKKLGAWPNNNEWDRLIVSSNIKGETWNIEHGLATITQDKPLIGFQREPQKYTVVDDSTVVVRGKSRHTNSGIDGIGVVLKSGTQLAGFRPLIEVFLLTTDLQNESLK